MWKVLRFERHQNPLAGLLKQTAGLHPGVSGSAGPGWAREFCIPNKISGDAEAAVPGTTH